jgi:O-antigen chain-terminating methyltransferase
MDSETINITETLAEIRRRVAARLSRSVPDVPELALPPLTPLREARAVCEGWAGGLGAVNPRPPGLLNSAAQALKTLMSRSLRWFAFPQNQFNQGVLASLIRTEDMFADINRNLVVLGQNLGDRQRKEQEMARRLQETEDAGRLAAGMFQQELERLRSEVSALAPALRQEITAAEERLTTRVHAQWEQMSRDVTGAVNQISGSVTQGLNEIRADVTKVRDHMEDEIRVVRQRVRSAAAAPAAVTAAAPATAFDYPRFEERFRGKEAEIRQRQSFYLPLLEGCAPVLDVACGRGELLELLRARHIAASGVDLDPDMVGQCREKGLAVEQADALAYLDRQPDACFGAVFSAQFVEHLPVAAYARLIELAFAKLRSGGRVILETQNPECLAIYSQTFFVDPTHVRPVPAAQLHFLLGEAGFRDLAVHYLSPVSETLPQLPRWPVDDQAGDEWNRLADRFNQTYFGHMDYAITGVKR